MSAAIEYIRMRRDAWIARSAGQIGRAMHLEEQADRIAVPGSRLEVACDDLANNPGTVASDWYILEQDWRAQP